MIRDDKQDRTGPRDPERETASLGWNPRNAAVCSHDGCGKMKYDYSEPGSHVAGHTTLCKIVNALNNYRIIKALICLHQTEFAYHGHYIRWQDELPRLMDGPRDYARLLLHLESTGLRASHSALNTALWLVPTVPEGLNPVRFLEAQEAAA